MIWNKKYFCLFIGLFFLILSAITHISCFSFGFVSGLGFGGWMLLSNESEEDDKNESKFKRYK